jgi:hypothetical protein
MTGSPRDPNGGANPQDWIPRFAAAGPRRISAKTREEFAELLTRELNWAMVWGHRQQLRITILPRIAGAALAARDAFEILRYEIAHSKEGFALHVRSSAHPTILGFEPFQQDTLDSIAWYLRKFTDLAQIEATIAPHHRGRRNDLAVTIVAGIAYSYHTHFGRWPAIGRRGRTPLPSPFDRVCKEVEALLLAEGYRQFIAKKNQYYPLTLSDSARKKGIRYAKSGTYMSIPDSDDQSELVRDSLLLGEKYVLDEYIRPSLEDRLFRTAPPK